MPDEPAQLPELKPKHARFVDAYFEHHLNAAEASRACGYRDRAEGSRLLAREDVAAHVQARLDAAGMTAAEVLARLTRLSRGDMSDFLSVHERDEPVYENRPLVEKLTDIRRRIDALHQFRAQRDTHLSQDQRATLSDKLARLLDQELDTELELALNPDATYQAKVGTRPVRELIADPVKAAELQQLGLVKKFKYEDGRLEVELHDVVRTLELMGKRHKLFTDKIDVTGDVSASIKFVVGVDEDAL